MSKHSKNIFNKWLSLTIDIYKNLPNVPALNCPSCNQLGIDFQFVGDLQTRIGFMVIWCPHCLNGIHLSRVCIPIQAQVIPFNSSPEIITKRIPNLIYMQPC